MKSKMKRMGGVNLKGKKNVLEKMKTQSKKYAKMRGKQNDNDSIDQDLQIVFNSHRSMDSETPSMFSKSGSYLKKSITEQDQAEITPTLQNHSFRDDGEPRSADYLTSQEDLVMEEFEALQLN